MNFWDHIEELRGRLIFLLALFVGAAAVSFFFMDDIMRFLQEPMSGYDISLYYREPTEKFFTYIRASLACALLALVPVAAIQTGLFVLPALMGRERRIFAGLMCSGIVLFYAGAFFAWKLIIPFALNFFINFARGDGILPLWGISDYVGLVLTLVLVIGFSFEFPMVMLAVIKSGIASVPAMARARRYVIPIFFLIAAIITPPDAITQIIVGLLLWGMFELTLIIGRYF